MMLAREQAWVVLVYVLSLAIGIPLITTVRPDHGSLAWAEAALVASFVAGILYHRRIDSKAPPRVKASVGCVLAGCALVSGLLTHAFVPVFRFPEVSIPIAVLGSFLAPFVTFGVGLSINRQWPHRPGK
jgi:hypothetical protein